MQGRIQGGGFGGAVHPPPRKKLEFYLRVALWTGYRLREKQCSICLRLQEKAFEIKKFPGRDSRTQCCSEIFLCQVLYTPPPRHWKLDPPLVWGFNIVRWSIGQKHFPENTLHRPSAGLMLGLRRRLWTNIRPAWGQFVTFAGLEVLHWGRQGQIQK